MPRPLDEIITQLRMAIRDTALTGLLIETADLEVLCDAAEKSFDAETHEKPSPTI